MKRILIQIVIFSTFMNFLYSQEWAPIGAKWYYTKNYNLNSAVSFSMIEVEKDTIINGKNCSKIIGEFDGCIWQSQFMYESNDSVFFYHHQNNTFEMLFNFGANPGDVWKIPNITTNFGQVTSDTLTLVVDSIDQITINSLSLRVIYTTQINLAQSNFEYGGKIIEQVGATIMFPYFFACDPVAGELRCYEDNIIHYQRDSLIDCEFDNLNISENNINQVQIYPNPVNNYVKLINTLPNYEKIRFKIYSMDGNVILKGDLVEDSIDVTPLNKGAYFLLLFDEEYKSIIRLKIIKL